MSHRLSVAVLTPAHSRLGWRADSVHLSGLLSYTHTTALPPGTLVRVPLGTRETLGIVWEEPTHQEDGNALGSESLRPVIAALDIGQPLNADWLRLVNFAASYYQRSAGELALNALPPALRDLTLEQWARRLRRKPKGEPAQTPAAASSPPLTPEQQQTLAAIDSASGPFLLFGATGSGKTEVYLQAVHKALQADPNAQALVMVPEINLTPQLESRFTARFAPLYGPQAVVALHSGLTPAQRLKNWLCAHLGPTQGGARIVLGTRMAIFASLPGLRLIVVDEEHDPSYKSQDGARYSARDLAVYRGQLEQAKVILGSATPSLESWRHCQPAADGRARYQRLDMPSRVGAGSLPQVRLLDMGLQPPKTVFAPTLLEAIGQRVARGEQSMILLNRRGYAPVLACHACGWKSDCRHCSAHRVFHKIDRTLRCHHCGFTERVPRACPECGNIDITPLGRGTEQIEEQLGTLFAGVLRSDGTPVKVARIDADSTRLKGELARQLAEVHSGEVDVLVGTQMVAKGHDFRRITLVAGINPDGALFSADFRAPERLFSLLMQAGGRAGRDSQRSAGSELWIQTGFPTHPLFTALKNHDFSAFAQQELADREAAGMPPFSFQALLRAEAKTQTAAQGFLQAVSAAAQALDPDSLVTRYPAVPLTIQRVANVERAQMLLESPSRQALQALMRAWHPLLHSMRLQPEHKGLIRWAIDVDPQLI